MKTIITYFIVMMAAITIHSQTVILPPSLNTWTLNSNSISFEDTTVWAPRKQQHFYLGWQWSGPNAATNKRLHCNFFQDHYMWGGTRNMRMHDIPDSGQIKHLVWAYLGAESDSTFYCQEPGFMFDPVADTAFGTGIAPLADDTTGATLGFKIHTSGVRGTGINKNRFLLARDNVATYPAVVLADPVVQKDYKIYHENDSLSALLNGGKKWVLSINLRRTLDTDVSTMNDTILKIRIPYKMRDTNRPKGTGYIIFDSIPQINQTFVTMLPMNRGKVMPMRVADPNLDIIYITRNMLPIGSATGINRDITLSAVFRFKSNRDSLTPPNPWLQGARDGLDTSIKNYDIVNLGIKVEYYGNAEIAVDWIRIATPDLVRLQEGRKDTLAWLYTHKVISIMRDSINAGRNIRLLAIYGKDEPAIYHYASQQYFKRLLAGRFTNEGNGWDSGRSFLGSSFLWFGGWTSISIPFTPLPYQPIAGDGQPSSRQYKWGWRDIVRTTYPGSGKVPDSTGSYYETDIMQNIYPPGARFLKIAKADSLDPYYYKKIPALTGMMRSNFDYDYIGTAHTLEFGMNFLAQSKVLYDTIPLWMNVWGTEPMEIKSNGTSYSSREYHTWGARMLTGEELRAQIYGPILMGIKGLMYDRMYSDTIQLVTYKYKNPWDVDSITVWCDTCLQNFGKSIGRFQGMMYNKAQIPTSLEGTALINSDAAGPDFLNWGDKTHIDVILNPDSTADKIGVRRNRVYIGKKSMRREVMKIHDLIHNNDALFMDMKLMASFHKGLFIFTSGDTSTFRRIISFDTSKILTRPVERVMPNGKPYYEDSDSTMLDIALHKIRNLSIDSTFVLAVMNRRTAPFIQSIDTVRNFTSALQPTFVTTAEFDSMVAVNPTLKYKQSGAREITIPFRYSHPDGKGRLLHIQELTRDSLTKSIDTIICRDCPLVVKFQPGEGKFFRVTTVLPVNYAIADSGSLETNSQRKMVSVPLLIGVNSINRTPIHDSTRMVHHLVYHIMDTIQIRTGLGTTVLQRRKVMYQQSNPQVICAPTDATNPISGTKQIIWKSPKLVSGILLNEVLPDSNICITNSEPQLLNHDCAFPSLVVRWDAVAMQEKVYIVYGCRGGSPIAPTAIDRRAVIECEFNATDTVINSATDNQIIARQNIDIREVAQPVINASPRGNFIAYDNLNQINIIWQHPNRASRCSPTLTPIQHSSISWYQRHYGDGTCQTNSRALHPSINSYTHPSDTLAGWMDDHATLVWQEKNDECNDLSVDSVWRENHIYLAVLTRSNVGGMTLRPGTADEDGLTLAVDSTMVRISRSTTVIDNFRNHHSPSVAQMTEPSSNGMANSVRSAWSASNATISPTTVFNGLFTGSFWLTLDTLGRRVYNTKLRTRTWCPCEVDRPNITTSGQTVTGDVYGTTERLYTVNALFDSTRYIHFNFNRVAYTTPYAYPDYILNGRNPQLSAQPMELPGNYWTHVRRVVNIKDSLNSTLSEKWKIRASHDLLFKRDANNDDYKITPMQGYLTLNSFVYLYDNSYDPEVLDEEKWDKTMRINKRRHERLNPIVETNWHKVGNEFSMPIFLFGTGLKTATLQVENRRTKARATIRAKFKNAPNPNEPLSLSLRLQNGGGDEYRLILSQEGVIGEPVADVFIGQAGSHTYKNANINESETVEVDLRETIDLHDGNMLSVFPDPNTGQNMTVQIHPVLVRNSRGNFKVLVMNELGQIVHSVVTPVTASIPLNGLSLANGVYHIRCEYTTPEYDLRIATTSIVVER
jgi:hypothetical protein